MNLQDIEKEIVEIQKEYSKTDFPKGYMRDTEYIKLKTKKQEMIQKKKDEKILHKELELIKKEKQEFFNELPDEAKKLLSDYNYDIFLDSDNILSFYPSKDTPLANKVMNIRLLPIKQKI